MPEWIWPKSTDLHVIDPLNRALRKIPPWLIYLAGLWFVVWPFWLGLTGRLGPEPIKALEHVLGQRALQLLILGLAITPLRRFVGLNLIRFRRAVGLTAFFILVAHLCVWLFLDLKSWDLIAKDLFKRPYIIVGMTALTLAVPLAITSNGYSVRRLGAAAWGRLHRLTYGVVLLGGIHFVMSVKGWQPEPLLYLTTILILLALRLIPRRRAAARPAAPRPTP